MSGFRFWRASDDLLPEGLVPGATVLRADDVTVSLDGNTVLGGVSIDVVAGEILALIGPNGAGKSTLLSVLSGDLDPTSGSVALVAADGSAKALGEWGLDGLSRRRAVLLQENEVFFPFTVQEVTEMGRQPWAGTSREDDDEAAVTEALELADITALSERHLPQLSGGERARAAFARVLAQRTGILMLDEPTAALDLGHQESVMRLARSRARAGDAVIVVLHDLSLAAAYADRIAVMSDGKIVACGDPSDIMTAPLLGRVYEHPVQILRDPATGKPVILPVRDEQA